MSTSESIVMGKSNYPRYVYYKVMFYFKYLVGWSDPHEWLNFPEIISGAQLKHSRLEWCNNHMYWRDYP